MNDLQTGDPRMLDPLCRLLRDLRRASRMSLATLEKKHGIKAVVAGAYERGDRIPPVPRLREMLGIYGYRLEAVPLASNSTRVPVDMVSELRAIADQLEAVQFDVYAVP